MSTASKPDELPSGALVVSEFLPSTDEQRLLAWIDDQEWTELAHRRVQHYGYEFLYGSRGINRDRFLGPLPVILEELGILPRLVGWSGHNLDQLTINEYVPGVGLRPHVDTHSAFKDCILSLSLNSGVSFEFRRGKADGLENDAQEERIYKVRLEPRSLLVMRDEARYGWRHYIPLRKTDPLCNGEVVRRSRRVSLTFRKVRSSGICRCQFPQLCDSQSIPRPPECETRFVYETYEAIAPHFSSTRFAVWPGVNNFLNALPHGSIVADIGCGNGKYLHGGSQNRSGRIHMIGADRSEALVDVAKGRGFDVAVADCLDIPLRAESVDGAIFIAVLHHIHSDNRRRSALREFIRILRPSGRGLIYVWAYEQERPEKTINRWEELEGGEPGDFLVPWQVPKGRPSSNDEEDWQVRARRLGGDFLDQSKSVHLKRYYHVFRQGELADLCRRVEGVEVVREWYDQSNWAVEIMKKG